MRPGCARAVITTLPPPLIQIRRRFGAALGNLRLTVETDIDGWSATVVDGGREVYSARRCSAPAAKAAAAEYAAFHTALPPRLDWTERG